MASTWLSAISLLALLPWVEAKHLLFPVPLAPPMAARSGPVTSRNGTTLPPFNTTFTFDQLVDHNNPSLGTFKQRFFHTAEFFEPGGPVILFTPGEVSFEGFDGYLTNETFNGQLAQQQNGTAVVLEHRFFGQSNPFPNLSEESFRVHTIQQAIDDLAYFAQNVKLPMPGGDQLAPGKAPWVLIGGSYSGALTSWTMVNKPDVFWAGYASSAVVEAITDYWEYFDPIRQFMPQNCSADVQAAVAILDNTLQHGSKAEVAALKKSFGMSAVEFSDDVASAVMSNLFDWQSLSPDSGPDGLFFQFCDALETQNGKVAPVSGFGGQHALNAWGDFWTTGSGILEGGYLNLVCGGTDDASVTSCLDTHNASDTFFTSTKVDNSNRSWMWFVCNFVGFYQVGAPEGTPSIVPRTIQPSYEERICTLMFPDTFKTIRDPNVGATNAAFDGWNVEIPRLFFANGQRDPWRDATVSSDFHTRQSTAEQPIAEGDGFHCSDLISDNGADDPTVLAVQQKGLAQMQVWLSQWRPGNKLARRDDEHVRSALFRGIEA